MASNVRVSIIVDSPPKEVKGVAIPNGTFFLGRVNSYGKGLYFRGFSSVHSMEPLGGRTDKDEKAFRSFTTIENVEVKDYQPVDVSIECSIRTE